MAVTAGRLSAGTPASAQPASPPTFRSEARYVEVDAVVTDRDGHVVRGLTRDDFQALEAGKPQNISTFLSLDLPVDAPADRAVPAMGPVVADVQSASKRDGKFHRIDVEVTRPGLRVQARRGHVAPSGRAPRVSLGKLGVRAFIDAATVYDAGAHLRRQRFERGVGGGVWFTATVIRLAFDVAHGSNGGTRAQLSSGLAF